MKIYQFISDSEEQMVKPYNGLFCTGIMFIPGPYDFYPSVKELLAAYNKKPEYIVTVEKHQAESYFQRELQFMDRPFIHWGPGNHKMVEVFDTRTS